ncbi:MAG: hypothetical protein D6834_03230 [Aquificota bacterium]|nr:MAG: hypothetical protein D6834_03230 [Aquificota bacterium]
MSHYKSLDKNFQEEVLTKWKPLLEEESLGKIEDEYTKLATAIVLENMQRHEDSQRAKNRALLEAYAGVFPQNGAMGAQTAGVDGGGAFGSYNDFTTQGVSPTDARVPSIVIPIARRIFPELIAHELVGVQPLTTSIGWAFAIRAVYGAHGKGGSLGASEGDEIGYNIIDSAFTGASGNAATVSANAYFQAFAGANVAPDGVSKFANQDGQGATLNQSEWWNIGEDMPQIKFEYLKGSVEAKTRKVGAQWSLELAEDMMSMHGTDVNSEMINFAQYEIKAEIDRQLLTEMVKAAILNTYNGTPDPNVSTWSPVSADGRDQYGRMQTLYTHLLLKSQLIATKTRRGAANFAVMSPTPVALFEQLGDIENLGRNAVATTAPGVAKVGFLKRGQMNVYRDSFAGGNYILLGYKGVVPYDAGIIYCPYIPVEVHQAIGQENFTPRAMVRTRYGILSNLFGSGNFYHLIKLDDLTNAALNADGGRVFLY